MQRDSKPYAMTFKTTCDLYTGKVPTLRAGPVIQTAPYPFTSHFIIPGGNSATVMLFPLGNRWGVHWLSPQSGCLECKWWQVYFQTVQGGVPFLYFHF